MNGEFTVNGWTCSNCGEFVPINTYHVCGTKAVELAPLVSTGEIVDTETKAILERIAVALETIARRSHL